MINVIKKVLNKIINLDFPGMAAEMAFNFTFALFPFFIFLISIFGLLGSRDMVNRIIQTLSVVVPGDIVSLIEKVLNNIIESSSFGLLTFGFLIAVWTASNAINILFKSINRTYDIEETRPFWKIRLYAIIMIFVIAIVLFTSINLIIFGGSILEFIKNFIEVPGDIEYSLLLVRWPVSFLTLFLMALLLYYLTPNIHDKKRVKLKSAIPGTLFFCVFWLAGSWVFGLYVENFGRYNETFGILGGFIVLLTWLYYSSFIILTGGVINSEYYKKYSKE